MRSWGFFTDDGNELSRGWQGWEHEAKSMCQSWANRTGKAVECAEEPCAYDHERDQPAEPMCVCEPRGSR